MDHEASFFADPKNWVVLAFILFFVLFGKKLWSALAAMLDGMEGEVVLPGVEGNVGGQG